MIVQAEFEWVLSLCDGEMRPVSVLAEGNILPPEIEAGIAEYEVKGLKIMINDGLFNEDLERTSLWKEDQKQINDILDEAQERLVNAYLGREN